MSIQNSTFGKEAKCKILNVYQNMYFFMYMYNMYTFYLTHILCTCPLYLYIYMYLITINLLIEFHKKKIKINIFDIDSFNNSLLNPLNIYEYFLIIPPY